jgi:intracellular sulfur oxidation DsrE/DsrF family protein
VKLAAGGAISGGLAAALPARPASVDAAFVPNNFRAVVHVTSEDGMQYAFAALETITENYDKATARLVIDGSAVKLLTTDDGLNSIKAAHDAGAEIVVANDALAINGIDPSTLPDYIDKDNPGVIAVVDSQVKGFHYYKV